MIWSDVADEILSVGIPMPYGIKNWALTKEQALSALDAFFAADIAILGGDVCPEINGRIFPNGDTWSCEKGNDESEKAFLIRSITESRNYIRRYPSREGERIFFNLVPDTEN